MTNKLVKKIHCMQPSEVDRNTVMMCEFDNHCQNLDTVLSQWKYTCLHSGYEKEKKIFESFLLTVYSIEAINAMEGVLGYER